MADKPSAHDLWKQAGGGTPNYDRAEYHRLAVEHGLLIPLAPGEKAEPLPCEWPQRRVTDVEQERERLVAEWHDAPADSPIAQLALHEHMDLTWDEYREWMEGS